MSTLTQQFASEYAKNVVPAMLRTIRNTKRFTLVILAGVLAISYPHQAMFLATVDGVGWLGWVIPVVVDVALLTMVNIVQTVGMAQAAKRAALWMIVFCGLISATVNVAAPAALMARIIFGAIVAVAVGVKLVSSKIAPDFSAIEARETEVAAATAPASDPNRSKAARQAAETRKANKLAAEQEKAERAERRRLSQELRRLEKGEPIEQVAAQAAPVSPAPLGYL
jgi:signal transduction histidine kinase